ncbi:MAG: PilZ domain-containing protein [Acidobacteriota bacterium]
MGREQRRAPRVTVDLAAWWEGSATQQEASITSLSVTGCFVLTGGSVEARERIRLEITFPDGTQIYPWAEVVEEASEIGFAVQFTTMEAEESELLERFVRQALADAT